MRRSWPEGHQPTGGAAPPIPARNPARRQLAALPAIQRTSADFTSELTNALAEPSRSATLSVRSGNATSGRSSYHTRPSDLPLRAASPSSTPQSSSYSSASIARVRRAREVHQIYSIPEERVLSRDRGFSDEIVRAQDHEDDVFLSPSAANDDNRNGSLQRSASLGSRPGRRSCVAFETPRAAPATPIQRNDFTAFEAPRPAPPTPIQRITFSPTPTPGPRATTPATSARRSVRSPSPAPRATTPSTPTQRDSFTPFETPRTAPATPTQRSALSPSPAPRAWTPATSIDPRASQQSRASTHDKPLPPSPDQPGGGRSTAVQTPGQARMAGQNDQCTICQKTGKPLQPNPFCCADPPGKVEEACLECWQESLRMGLANEPEYWMCCFHCGRELLQEERTRLAKKRTLVK